MTWTARPNANVIFSRFCAPTALAGLMGCTKLEAAETLLAVPGMPHPSTGAVHTGKWRTFLVELGLTPVSTERSMDERKAGLERAVERGGWGDYENVRYITTHSVRSGYVDRRQNRPSIWDRTIRFPTVAQWLKANPDVTAVLLVRGHTLYVENGQVAADTMRTNSMRARLEEALVLDPK